MTRKPTGQPRRLRGRAKPVMAWAVCDERGNLVLDSGDVPRISRHRWIVGAYQVVKGRLVKHDYRCVRVEVREK
jgi:hypothetical protein